MPPANAKKQDKAQQKALEKQKQKIAEDKTFGLKNKNKSKAVQKFIKSVQSSIKGSHNVSEQKQNAAEKQKKEEKKKQLQEVALLNALFKNSEDAKKNAAKQSPDFLKADQKIDVYTDQRDRNNDSMADWDQNKLEAVIKEKHGQSRANATDIVCKYFIEAVEKRQYGWFWKCPNGGNNCKYRHCLPQNYIFKSKVTEPVEENEETLETTLERERAALPANGTKTSVFRKKKKLEAKQKATVENIKDSKKVLSGRDLFTFDKSLFFDDAAAASEDDYKEEEGYWDKIINENQSHVDASTKDASNDALSKNASTNASNKDESDQAAMSIDTLNIRATKSDPVIQDKSKIDTTKNESRIKSENIGVNKITDTLYSPSSE